MATFVIVIKCAKHTRAQVHDAAAALEAIHDSHLGQLLPRVRQCDEQVADFLARCVNAKAAMGRDVLEQLQVGCVVSCLRLCVCVEGGAVEVLNSNRHGNRLINMRTLSSLTDPTRPCSASPRSSRASARQKTASPPSARSSPARRRRLASCAPRRGCRRRTG